MCCWIDAPIASGADREALFEAQRCFERFGVRDTEWVGMGRAATVDEARDPTWSPMLPPSPRTVAATALDAAIDRAFVGGSPEGRVTLTEAFRRGFYGAEPAIAWDDRDTDWRQIPAEVLEYFLTRASVFAYGNADSLRYYLPAYLRHGLQTRDVFALVRALGHGPLAATVIPSLAPAEREVVVAYLRFLLDFHGPEPEVSRALDQVARAGAR